MANVAEAVVEVSEEGTVDIMSNLSDELLCHIFSFLPSHYSTRITSLSTRFQYLWRSVPILDFWDNQYPRYSFEKVMDNALKNHEKLAIIRRFRLWCLDFTYDKSVIFNWIDLPTTASHSNLEVFDIHLARPYWLGANLSRAIFSCRKLKTIRLSGGIIMDEIPTDVHVFFPCLKTLRLKSISIVGGNTANKLISGCPRIEIFDIEECFLLSDMSLVSKISEPHVTIKKLYVKYHIKPSGIVHEDGDLSRVLTMASASINVNDRDYKSKATFDFFKSISNIVKQLEIYTIHGFPYNYSSRNAKFELPNDSYYKLEMIEIINGTIGVEEMEIVKYFLKNALILKKLILCCKNIREEIKTKIMDEPRSSSKCEIEIDLFQ